jgi:hypothetical protein
MDEAADRSLAALQTGLSPDELLDEERIGLLQLGYVTCGVALGVAWRSSWSRSRLALPVPPILWLPICCLAALEAGKRSDRMRQLGWALNSRLEREAARERALLLRLSRGAPGAAVAAIDERLGASRSLRWVGQRAVQVARHAGAVGTLWIKRSRVDRLALWAWRASPLPAWKAHIEWNWSSFLTQEAMASGLQEIIAQKKREEGERRG